MDSALLGKIYVCCIAGGAAVPVFQLLIGGFSGALELDVDFDGDCGDGPFPGGLMGLAFFAVVFGALGRLLLGYVGPLLSLLAGAAGGALGAWLLGRFIIRPLRRSNPAALRMRDLRWQTGRVKLEIREDFSGKVTLLSAAGSLITYSALPAPGVEKIEVGQEVMVVEVDEGRRILTVSPLHPQGAGE